MKYYENLYFTTQMVAMIIITIITSIQTLVDKSTETAEITWAALSAVSKPVGQQCCIQKAWDGPIQYNTILL